VRLLVTRPRPEAERTAAILRAQGHTVVVAPLLRIEAVIDVEIGAGPWAAIVVTSANAGPAIAGHQRFPILRTLPVLAVGRRSADAMRDAGFAEVTSADGDVGDLVRLVAERLPRGAALLYLAGAERAGDLAGDLAARGFAVETIVVYRAIAAASFAPDAVQAIGHGIDGVLHYSPRSAAVYAAAARAGGLIAAAVVKPAQFCLSAHVAEPLAQAGATDIRIAPQPNEAALIALLPPA
jgi:uroporphyrinogen-III synthase